MVILFGLHKHKQKNKIIEIETFFPEKDTLVLSALTQSLQDDKLLVQRETLELINSFFKFKDGYFFKKIYNHFLLINTFYIVFF